MSHKEEGQFSLHFSEGQKAGSLKKVQKIPLIGLLCSCIICVMEQFQSSLLDMTKSFFYFTPLSSLVRDASTRFLFPQAALEELDKWELSQAVQGKLCAVVTEEVHFILLTDHFNNKAGCQAWCVDGLSLCSPCRDSVLSTSNNAAILTQCVV